MPKCLGVWASATASSLLLDNVATGTDTLADTTGFVGYTGVLSSSTAYAYAGARSLGFTTVGAPEGVAVGGDHLGASPKTIGPLVPGTSYTAGVWVRSQSSDGWTVRIYWWGANAVSAISNTTGSTVSTAAGAWTLVSHTASAPTGAYYASFYVRRPSGVAGVVTNMDQFSWAAT